MRGLQGHSHKTAHTCSFRSGRICPGAPVDYELQDLVDLLLFADFPGSCLIGAQNKPERTQTCCRQVHKHHLSFFEKGSP